MRSKLRRVVGSLWPTLVLVVVMGALWQLYLPRVSAERVSRGLARLENLVPTPLMIADSFVSNFGILQSSMVTTGTKAGLGFVIGSVLALLMVVLFALSRPVRRAVLPLNYVFHSFPVVGLVPAIVLMFGQGTVLSISVISAMLSYFPILMTYDNAITNTPREFIDLGRMYDSGRWKELRFIRSPLALPALFVGLRLSAPGALVGAVIGELLGSNEGVGRTVSVALYQLDPGVMYAMLGEVAVVCGLIVGVITLVEKVTVPWL